MENEALKLPLYECEMINISTNTCEVVMDNPLAFNPFKCQFSLKRKEYYLFFKINSNIYYRNADMPNKWCLYKSIGEYKVTTLEDYDEEDVKSICVQVIYQHIVRHSHCIYVDYRTKIGMFDFNILSRRININPIKRYLDEVKDYLPSSLFKSEEFCI